jgi:hypothetical protein
MNMIVGWQLLAACLVADGRVSPVEVAAAAGLVVGRVVLCLVVVAAAGLVVGRVVLCLVVAAASGLPALIGGAAVMPPASTSIATGHGRGRSILTTSRTTSRTGGLKQKQQGQRCTACMVQLTASLLPHGAGTLQDRALLVLTLSGAWNMQD